MKKLYISAAICLIMLFGTVISAFAELTVVETPEVKIVIDGKMSTYKDVPLSVNQRTMLPLRELLGNLGVSDENIVWNNEEKSVTILKDNTSIFLQIGNTTAIVNGQPVTLDIAPLGYINQRVYIPARFVSEALNKKVVWDGSAKAVLIRDADGFNRTRELLEKSNAAMETVTRSKINMNVGYSATQSGITMNMGVSASGELDRTKKLMHMLADISMLGINMKTEYYYNTDYMYFINPANNSWEKMKLLKAQSDGLFQNSNSLSGGTSEEPLYAGLVIQEGGSPDETVLKGEVFLDELYGSAMKMTGDQGTLGSKPGEDLQLDKFFLQVVIDNRTNLIKSYSMQIESTMLKNEMKPRVKVSLDARYSDYNGKFDLTIPKEVLSGAVEMGEGGRL